MVLELDLRMRGWESLGQGSEGNANPVDKPEDSPTVPVEPAKTEYPRGAMFCGQTAPRIMASRHG